MYQLAIFDLDGTLLDTLADLHAGASTMRSARLRLRPAARWTEVRAFVGNGALEAHRPRRPGRDESRRSMDAVLAEAFRPLLRQRTAPT